MHILSALTSWLVDVIGSMGYTGIISLMFLESSFFPFPSEVVMPPAGYLAWKGEMSLPLVLIAGIAGSLLGALFNYWLAVKLGRPLLIKYGKYFFISQETIDKADRFFQKHGHISTFVCRLLPGIRQYVSLPAGLARMPMKPFCLYTGLGAGIWVAVLTFAGYLLGEHQELLKEYLHVITIGCIALACVIAGGYYFIQRRRKNKS
ncbi:MAG: DedA family protein [Synergistaceae bacterium]|nr:DedA family protein [Synergistaceae bacterium]MBQ3449787.1 DedA family protein [Synergistaceae bacterium]MBQ3694470.1 DedA family protein [Synergistaceae bacterium]MBQ6111865.1 DedA family protein [Synergistaceae bacterium]MBQ9629658.1 DedA family protein [Synergistaceae bacterium]